jgi:hypothetical protein
MSKAIPLLGFSEAERINLPASFPQRQCLLPDIPAGRKRLKSNPVNILG